MQKYNKLNFKNLLMILDITTTNLNQFFKSQFIMIHFRVLNREVEIVSSDYDYGFYEDNFPSVNLPVKPPIQVFYILIIFLDSFNFRRFFIKNKL